MTVFQATRSSCGSAALANAVVLVRSTPVTEDVVMKLAGTSPDGTSMKGIMKAANKLGLYAEKVRAKEFPAHVTDPLIVCCDQDQHWIVAQITGSGRWLVVDSANNEMVWTVTLDELKLRATKHGARKPFTAIIIRETP